MLDWTFWPLVTQRTRVTASYECLVRTVAAGAKIFLHLCLVTQLPVSRSLPCEHQLCPPTGPTKKNKNFIVHIKLWAHQESLFNECAAAKCIKSYSRPYETFFSFALAHAIPGIPGSDKNTHHHITEISFLSHCPIRTVIYLLDHQNNNA